MQRGWKVSCSWETSRSYFNERKQYIGDVPSRAGAIHQCRAAWWASKVLRICFGWPGYVLGLWWDCETVDWTEAGLLRRIGRMWHGEMVHLTLVGDALQPHREEYPESFEANWWGHALLGVHLQQQPVEDVRGNSTPCTAFRVFLLQSTSESFMPRNVHDSGWTCGATVPCLVFVWTPSNFPPPRWISLPRISEHFDLFWCDEQREVQYRYCHGHRKAVDRLRFAGCRRIQRCRQTSHLHCRGNGRWFRSHQCQVETSDPQGDRGSGQPVWPRFTGTSCRTWKAQSRRFLLMFNTHTHT